MRQDQPTTPTTPSWSRRTVLRTAGVAGAGSLIAGGATAYGTVSGRPDTEARRPNIVLIVADDLGYSDLGCYGSEIATPNLDRMARGGMRLTQMYNNARCCPTRASILTGLYPTQTGVGFMTKDQGTPQYQGYLNRSCVTLGEVLGGAGYRTSMSGKWHVAPAKRTGARPYARGFERTYEVGGGNYFEPMRWLNGEAIGKPTDPRYYSTHAITKHAVRQMRNFAASGKPFFQYVAYHAPHFPLHAWPARIEQYRGKYKPIGWDRLRRRRYERAKELGVVDPDWRLASDSGVPSWEDARHKDWQDARMAVYAAMVSTMDAAIGRIVRQVHDLGIARDTMIVFLADNGASAERIAGNDPSIMPGPRDTSQSYGQGWAYASDSPFKRFKRWTHEGGISGPGIVWWPGTTKPGSIGRRVLHVTDLMPTFVNLAGATYPRRYNGRDIRPMEGRGFANLITEGPVHDPASPKPDAERRMVFWEHMGNRAVRQGRWKLVSDYPGRWELYDMVADRTETRNVAAGHPVKVEALATAYRGWKRRVGVRSWDPQKQYRP